MKQLAKNRSWKLVLTFYTVGIFIVLYLAYNRGIPAAVASIAHYDLIGHFTLYGAWSYLAYRGFDRKITAPSILSLITIIEELAQMLSVNRTFSLIDLFFSLLGIWLVVLIDRQLTRQSN